MIERFESPAFLRAQKQMLLAELEAIENQMTGDRLDVMLELLCDDEGNYSAEVAQRSCDEFVDCIDTLQKCAWALCDVSVNPEVRKKRLRSSKSLPDTMFVRYATHVRKRVAAWKRQWMEEDDSPTGTAVGAAKPEDVPTTLTPQERSMVEAFVWCAMHVCSCKPFRRMTVSSLRQVMHETAQFIGDDYLCARDLRSWIDPGEPLSADDVITQAERHPVLTHEALLEREAKPTNVSDLASVSPDRVQGNLFDLMDYLYGAVCSGWAPTLESDEVMDAFMGSDKGKGYLKDWLMMYEGRQGWFRGGRGIGSLRLLTNLDEDAWRALPRGADFKAVRDSFDSSSDEVLDRLPELLRDDTSILHQEMLGNLEGALGCSSPDDLQERWMGMGRQARLDAIEESFAKTERMDTLNQEYENSRDTKIAENTAGVIEWAESIEDLDNLFDRYRLLRNVLRCGSYLRELNIDEVRLPQGGPYLGHAYARDYSPDLPIGFVELIDQALDIFLAEHGVAYFGNDRVYHRTLAYLQETHYQMGRAVEAGWRHA